MSASEPLAPPPQLTSIGERVERDLARLFAAESQRWAAVDLRLSEAIDELADNVLRGGKRLRAAFCYWAAVGTAGTEPEAVWDAAGAFELLQGFALIHDDVMDDADTRRGEPTVHVRQARRLQDRGWQGEPRRYGEGVAILVGDLGHVYADRLTGRFPPAARTIWDELRIELNLGQYLDLRSAAAGELDAATASQVALFKSGLYTIVRPLQLGAALTPASSAELLDRLDAYGRPLGRAFQLRDDVLGVVGDVAAVGKPVGDDLREGKATELLATALEVGSEEQRRLLRRAGRKDLDPSELSAMVEALHDTGAVSLMEARIDELVSRSIDAAAGLPFEDHVREALVALASYVGGRDR